MGIPVAVSKIVGELLLGGGGAPCSRVQLVT